MTRPVQPNSSGDLQEGAVIGRYRVQRRLASGAMGFTYLAELSDSVAATSAVVLKILRPGLDSAELRRRFERERQILELLDGAPVPRLLGHGQTAGGLPYFAIEHIAGRPIDAHCGELRLALAARLALHANVCRAVQDIHDRGVVHGDLKPENVFVGQAIEGSTDRGIKVDDSRCVSTSVPRSLGPVFPPLQRTTILDFGVARIIKPDIAAQYELPSDQGSQICTPDYASPEQLAGQPTTLASDIYSLGVVLYELLTCRRPHERGGLRLAAFARMKHETPSAPLSGAVAVRWTDTPAATLAAIDEIARRSLSVAAEERYTCCRAMREALDAAARLATPE